ncbi:site-specific integrase [Saccharopolyspora pogona]|uniref:site-specific integrase n=1 Tax=Saccharopolyspora pogona TaxID=333966 RepID=UPI0016822CCB|nr:site-specific integrase [Saccharopolyspora pogona]
MIASEGQPRDLAGLAVPSAGSLMETGDVWEPSRLLDPHGAVLVPVAEFLKDLRACGRAVSTQRSYTMALLRWFRFLWAVGVSWDQATQVEARDFCCWIQFVDKPVGSHGHRFGRSADAVVAESGVVQGNRTR